MKTIEQIRVGLRHHNLRAVSKASGVSYMTVWRAVRGDTMKLSYGTVKALSDYLEKQQVEASK